MVKTAVFGGTFNPFHIGHYEILKSLCESDLFDRVLLMPDRLPPHKEFSYDVDDQDRIEMCRIVCDDFNKAELCLVEFEREGKSYTVDTIKELKMLYPDNEFFVVCGGDMIKSLGTWYDFKNLKEMVRFVAFRRCNKQEFLNDVERMRTLGADILVFDKPVPEVSSTQLRKEIKPEFLPEKVYDYVNKRGIYKQ